MFLANKFFIGFGSGISISLFKIIKLGFKEVGQITSPDEDTYWGGLVGMRLTL